MDLLSPLLLPLITLIVFMLWRSFRPPWKDSFADQDSSSEKSLLEQDPYANIEPLADFEWSTTPPVRVRPFKSKYHLTMALETIPLSDLIAMDNTYLDRINLRRNIMSEHFNSTVQCNPIAESAVMELYGWIFGTYLPKRFPNTFQLVNAAVVAAAHNKSDAKTEGIQLFNSANKSYIPLNPESPLSALRTLGENVDTDFLLLLPSSSDTTTDGLPVYHFEAFVTCFPSGFSTREKLGLPLADVHGPVPGYKTKLEKSMDRFFAKLETGRMVKRANWTITTNDLLFCETGTHFREEEEDDDDDNVEGNEPPTDLSSSPPPSSSETSKRNAKTLDMHAPDLEADIAQQRSEVVIEKCRLRTERQTLFRLPNTQALVFSFKTYLYRLEEVKAEGSGPDLAAAIEGLTNGNVPEMNFYKRGVVWSDKVLEYLKCDDEEN